MIKFESSIGAKICVDKLFISCLVNSTGCEVSVFESISTSLAVSSVMIGAASFLLGFYLAERNRGVPGQRLNVFRYLIMSLILPIFGIALFPAFAFPLAGTEEIFAVACCAILLLPTISILAIMVITWK